MYENIINEMNAASCEKRLEAAENAKKLLDDGKILLPDPVSDVNNHIHTIYSFSPYSPTMAVWKSKEAGLLTCGIMDHDSISGAREFIRAGEILDVNVTAGIECRADMTGTALEGKRFNNPDQENVAYMALHAVPHSSFDEITAFFRPRIEKRNERNRKMVARLAELIDIDMDFDRDVLPLSAYAAGGSVTERHILFAAANMIIRREGKRRVPQYLTKLGINVSDKIRGYLEDQNNPYFEYDLLGVLKSDLVAKFFIPATDELPGVREVAALAKRTGAIFAYAYLGDVGESVTGDKKAQKFEDGFLDELFVMLKDEGFDAVTYMPSRNTDAQIDRLKALCAKYSLMEISGEDINTPRQKFVCLKQREPKFANLKSSAFALIGSENAEKFGEKPMFDESVSFGGLDEKIDYYAGLAKRKK